MSFDYFIFEMLSVNQCVSALKKDGDSEADIRHSFRVWVKEYCHRADKFYDSQYRRHDGQARNEFVLLHGREDDSDEWQKFRKDCGLESHEQAFMKIRSELQDYHNLYSSQSEDQNQDVKTIGNILDLAENETLPVPLHVFDEFWFNTAINNPPEEQNELCSLFDDDYFKTIHWQRVRAAVMLIYRAGCQHETCLATKESFYGREEELHVRESTKKRRGNERFGDLRLLCNAHN